MPDETGLLQQVRELKLAQYGLQLEQLRQENISLHQKLTEWQIEVNNVRQRMMGLVIFFVFGFAMIFFLSR
jgi:hypothetical protein